MAEGRVSELEVDGVSYANEKFELLASMSFDFTCNSSNQLLPIWSYV